MQTKMSNAIQTNNSSLMLQVSNDLTVQVRKSSEHEFLMTTSEVAHGYDCSTDAILATKSRNSEEFEEGKHFFSETDKLSASSNLQTTKLFWTKRGVVRLGFFIKTGRAKLFRDWAEDLIINHLQSKYRLKLRESEEQLLSIVAQKLIKGDVIAIAQELNLSPKHISAVKTGRRRSERVLSALVARAHQNHQQNRTNGYSHQFVQTSLNLFN